MYRRTGVSKLRKARKMAGTLGKEDCDGEKMTPRPDEVFDPQQAV